MIILWLLKILNVIILKNWFLILVKEKKSFNLHQRIYYGLQIKNTNQSNWLKPYIEKNTVLRTTAETDFEKDFFQLMNNSVFGKTMKNITERVDIRLVRSEKKLKN